jgi:hypothetical protein
VSWSSQLFRGDHVPMRIIHQQVAQVRVASSLLDLPRCDQPTYLLLTRPRSHEAYLRGW